MVREDLKQPLQKETGQGTLFSQLEQRRVLLMEDTRLPTSHYQTFSNSFTKIWLNHHFSF